MQLKWSKRRNRLILASAFVLLVVLQGCSSSQSVRIHGQKINVEIADTAEEREQGLMNRESLCDRCGMLFVFDEEGKYSFWMKDTLIPLDMVFIDKNGIIVNIYSAEPCAEEQCESYTPTDNAKYVLEVNKGFVDMHHINEGDAVTDLP